MTTLILSLVIISLLVILALQSDKVRKQSICISNQRETIDNNNTTIATYKSILSNGVCLPAEMKCIQESTIDFATWYSGMNREKVERAYSKYLSENPKSV